jgi:putative transposase
MRWTRRWPFGSLARRLAREEPDWLLPLNRWPVQVPGDWIAWVNRAETAAELEALRVSVQRGRPYGEPRWQKRTAARLELESTLRPRGRPRVHPFKDSRPL